MYKVIKASAVSLRGKPWDKAHNADKMEKFIRLAARKLPDLVVLPEGILALFQPPPAEVLDWAHR